MPLYINTRITFHGVKSSIICFLLFFLSGKAFAQAPTIHSFSPMSGKIGTEVTILGANFDPDNQYNLVRFGAVKAEVRQSSKDKIVVSVPIQASNEPISILNLRTHLCTTATSPFFPMYNLVLSTTLPNAPNFEVGDIATGNGISSFAVSDLNDDDRAEIIFVNSTANMITVLPNSGSTNGVAAAFNQTIALPTGVKPYQVKVCDLDGDGKPDIVVSNSGDNSISIFRNLSINGELTAGSFTKALTLAGSETPQRLEISDINLDGRPDIVVSNEKGNSISIFENNSRDMLSFLAKVDIMTGGSPISLAIGDANSDGYPDLVIVNKGIDSASIFSNTGKGGTITSSSFAEKVDFEGVKGVVAAMLADLDDDQKAELLILGTTNNQVAVRKNKTTGASLSKNSFDAAAVFAIGNNLTRLDISDMNADGKPDIIAHGDLISYNSTYLRNNTSAQVIGNNSFIQEGYLGIFNVNKIISCNIDNDDMPDWIFNNSAKGTISYIQAKIKAPIPLISSFSPQSAKPGSIVIISGANFNADPKLNTVYFGATKAIVRSGNMNQLQVEVPKGATYATITVTEASSRLSTSSLNPFIPTFSGKQQLIAGDLSNAGTLEAKSRLNPLIADIDADGHPDLIVANESSYSFSVYRNISQGKVLSNASFSSKTDYFMPGYISKLALSDLDGDGKPDVVAGTYNSKFIFLNKSMPGNIVFTDRIDFGPASSSGTFAGISDLQLDGKPDIAVTENADVNFFLNNTNLIGKPNFTLNQPRAVRSANSYTGMESIDLDGDRLPDILLYDYISTMAIYRNVTPVGYQSPFPVKTELNLDYGAKKLVYGDLDNDGKQDLIILNSTANTMTIFRNTSATGNISFVSTAVFDIQDPRAVSLSDLNGDGKVDLAVISGKNNLILYQNKAESGDISTAAFSNKISIPVGTALTGIASGDLDEDGKPDLVLIDLNERIIFLKNTPINADLQLRNTATRSVFKTLSKVTPTPLVIDHDLSVLIPSTISPTRARVSVKENLVSTEDRLGLIVDTATMGQMIASYDATTGELWIDAPTGASASQWQAALTAVSYTNNNTLNPDIKDRKVVYEIYYDAFKSNAAEKTIGIDFTNQSNASLQILSVTGGNMVPAFSSDVTNYRILAGLNSGTAIVYARLNDPLASLQVNGLPSVSGMNSQPIALEIGRNIIKVEVLAKDGITRQVYELEVTRSAKAGEINFIPFANVKYGDTDIAPIVMSTNGSIPVTYTSSNPAIAAIVQGKIRIYNAGSVQITASQAASEIDPVIQNLIIEKAPLKATVSSVQRVFGVENPNFTLSYSGFIKSEDAARISKPAIFNTSATITSPVGSYPITASGAEIPNYELSYLSGSLNITPAFDITSGITPIIFSLDAEGKRNISLNEVTKTMAYSKAPPNATISPAVLDCPMTGEQVITVSSSDGNPINTGVTFNDPSGVAVDKSGNIYIGDTGNHLIRKISPSGQVTTFSGTGLAGSANGNISTASFNNPMGLTFDDAGNLFVAERAGSSERGNIRKITPSGEVSTIPTNQNPTSVAVDKSGNLFFVCGSSGTGQNGIWKISSTGVISKFATNAEFDSPTSISIDKDGYYLYVADAGNDGRPRVRRINPEGSVQTSTGQEFKNDGSDWLWYYDFPVAVTAGLLSGEVYVAVRNNEVSRIPSRQPGFFVSANAGLRNVKAMALDMEGNIIVADAGNHSIKKITPDGQVSNIAGNGNTGSNNGDLSGGNNGQVNSIQIPVTVKSRLEITSALPNIVIPINSSGKGTVPDFTGTTTVKSSCKDANISISQSIAAGSLIDAFKAVSIIVTATDKTGGMDSKIFNITAMGNARLSVSALPGPLTFVLNATDGKRTLRLEEVARVDNPMGVKFTGSLQPSLFDCNMKGQQTLKVTVGAGVNGNAASAGMRGPFNIALDRAGNFYITDNIAHKVKKITTSGDVITLAGNAESGSADGIGLEARFNSPRGIAVDQGGNLFVADYENNKIRKISPDGSVSTFVGDGTYFDRNQFGTKAAINHPMSVATDQQGNIYFTETSNLIRKISPEGMVTAFAGTGGGLGSSDGTGTAAGINGNGYVICDPSGNVFLTDRYDGKIRKITPAGVVSTLPVTVSLADVRGIAMDKNGLIYVAQPSGYYNGKILKFNQEGLLLQTMIPPNSLTYWRPEDLVVDDSGNVFVVDTYNSSIQKFSPTGVMATFFGKIFSDDLDGNIGFKQENTVSIEIPVNIQSVPIWTRSLPDQIMLLDEHAAATLPDYTKTAAAIDLCSKSALQIVQSPVAGSQIKSDDIIILTATNTEGNSISTSFKILGIPIPKIIAAGPTSFSQGGSVVLSTNPSSGYTYQWKKDGQPISNQFSQSYTATQSGIYTVTISMGAYSQTSAAITVTVSLPAPKITEFTPLTANSGTMVSIKGHDLNGVSQVTFGGVPASSFQIVSGELINAVIGNGATGSLTVVSPGGSASMEGFSFVPVPTVTANGPTSFVSGGSVVLTTHPGSGYNYQWKRDGIALNGATGSSLSVFQGGSYTVTISLNGISTVSLATAVTILALPVNNLKLTASSVTCKGANNGTITISATVANSYQAIISKDGTSTSHTFNTSMTIDQLSPGTYNICVNPAVNPSDVQCFQLKISAPQELSVYTSIVQDKEVLLSLSGGRIYYVNLNGNTYSTSAAQLSLALQSGDNLISVSTDLACQGKVERHIFIGNSPTAYPNPFEDQITVSIGKNHADLVKIAVFAADGKLVHNATYNQVIAAVQVKLAALQTGLYILRLTVDGSQTVHKIIKK